MAADFVAFEKALEELQVSPDQLKRLISSGAVRAFSDGGTFKFRRHDLDAFKSRQQTLVQGRAPAAPPEVFAEEIEAIEEIPELSLDEMGLVEGQGETSPPVTPSTAPTLSTEELSLDEIGTGKPSETQPASLEEMPQVEMLSLEGDLNVLEEGGGAEATQPIEIEGDIPVSAPNLGTVSMEVPPDIAQPPDDFGIPSARSGGLDVRREGSPMWAAAVAATSAALVFAAVAMVGIVKDRPVGFLEPFVDFLIDKSTLK